MRLDRRDDRGNIMILFAFIVLATFGVGTLMVDAGTVLTEGRQLQNGAENAALVVAGTCAEGACVTTAGNETANDNAIDGATQVETVCGTGPGLTDCSTSGQRAHFGCGPVPSGATPPKYAQVHTRAKKADGSPKLQGFMVRLMDPFMTPDHTGTEVRTCARAAYGRPAGLTGELPLAISECEFNYWVNLFGLVNEPFNGTGEAVLYFHETGGNGPSNCPSRAGSNQDGPGGFGWLTTNGTCAIATTTDGNGIEKPGNSVPNDCDAAAFLAMLNQPVHIPIFTRVDSNVYDIVNYASFHLTGYQVSGGPAYTRKSPTQPASWCASSARCISGYFTLDTTTTSGPLVGGTSYGAVAIRLVG